MLKGVDANAKSKRNSLTEFLPKNLNHDPRLKEKQPIPHINFPSEKAEINI